MKTIKTPLGLVVGGALGAFLIAAIGVSAHTTGLSGFTFTGVHHSEPGDVASGARQEPKESPEPSEAPKPKPSPTAEPTEKPETDETESEDTHVKASPSPGAYKDEESGSHSTSGSGTTGHPSGD